jgi:hypothetical protein
MYIYIYIYMYIYDIYRLAEELTVELQRQNEQIRVRREQVEEELSEV